MQLIPTGSQAIINRTTAANQALKRSVCSKLSLVGAGAGAEQSRRQGVEVERRQGKPGHVVHPEARAELADELAGSTVHLQLLYLMLLAGLLLLLLVLGGALQVLESQARLQPG